VPVLIISARNNNDSVILHSKVAVSPEDKGTEIMVVMVCNLDVHQRGPSASIQATNLRHGN
jgi:hypothetical protein